MPTRVVTRTSMPVSSLTPLITASVTVSPELADQWQLLQTASPTASALAHNREVRTLAITFASKAGCNLRLTDPSTATRVIMAAPSGGSMQDGRLRDGQSSTQGATSCTRGGFDVDSNDERTLSRAVVQGNEVM